MQSSGREQVAQSFRNRKDSIDEDPRCDRPSVQKYLMIQDKVQKMVNKDMLTKTTTTRSHLPQLGSSDILVSDITSLDCPS